MQRETIRTDLFYRIADHLANGDELGLSEHEAFLALQRQSRQKNRPMKEIAQAIILNAEVRQSPA